MTRQASRPKKRFALYWCSTDDGDEDWFVVADSARTARTFHEGAEGYDPGDASAERVAALPSSLQADGKWLDRGVLHATAGWPSDELLVACGAEIAKLPSTDLHTHLAIVTKDVRFGSRVFRAGDLISNMDRDRGVKAARLSVFVTKQPSTSESPTTSTPPTKKKSASKKK